MNSPLRAWSPRARRVFGVAALTGALLCVATLPLLLRAGTWLVVSEPVPDPQVIVSLSSHEWERLPLTAELAHRYPEAIVILTVPETVNEFNCHDCPNRVARLVRAGVDAVRVHVLPLALGGTHGEAVAVAAFLRHRDVHRVMVVTSPYHTRRSLATFRHELDPIGVEVGILPASATSASTPSRWWGSAYNRWYVRYEWAAIVYYAARYDVWSF
ncbi:MAG: YdcF family protein [Vicinamibacterales bacterium]